MKHCVIVGGEKAGKKTFVGCLYAALISYVNKNPEFAKVYFSPEELNKLSKYYESVIVMEDLVEKKEPITCFKFEYSIKRKSPGIFRFVFREREYVKDTIYFHILSLPIQNMEESQYAISNANIAICLLNMETLTVPEVKRHYETLFVELLKLFRRTNIHYREEKFVIMIVYTKYDLAYKNVKIFPKIIDKQKKYNRYEYGSKILTTFFPEIAREVRKFMEDKIRVMYFLSEVGRKNLGNEVFLSQDEISEKTYSYWEYYNLVGEILKYLAAFE
ncbi:MAG: hypothetical protein QW115_01190 [Thermoplasmata archaeon]